MVSLVMERFFQKQQQIVSLTLRRSEPFVSPGVHKFIAPSAMRISLPATKWELVPGISRHSYYGVTQMLGEAKYFDTNAWHRCCLTEVRIRRNEK